MAGRHGTRGLLPWLGLAFVIVLLDQFTKALIVGSFTLGDSRTVTGFFDIVRAHNRGAAFSFLAGGTGWQRWFFVALAIAAAGFIVWMLLRHGEQKLFCAALALILGGAVGNLIDRLMHGYVVDFLEFHWRFLEPLFVGGRFPAFNVADSAITVGAALLILDELRRVGRS
jgi:signal peptidase II